MKERLSWNTGW